MRERYQHAGAVCRAILGVAALAGALSVGGTLAAEVGAGPAAMMTLPPTPVARLADSPDIVTARGRVAEVFGRRFVLDDGAGRALVDTGPRGEDAPLVAAGAAVTVQGRVLHGELRAAFLADVRGTVTALGPEHAPRGPGAGDARHGPPCGPGRLPPPPAAPE